MNLYDWLTLITVALGVWQLPLDRSDSQALPGLLLIGFSLVFAHRAGVRQERRKRGSIKRIK